MAEDSSSSIYSKTAGPFLYDLAHHRFYSVRKGFVVGRSTGNLSFPHDGRLSRQHFRIEVEGGRNGTYFLRDLKATNATSINGKPVSEEARIELSEGDVIEAGDQVFCYLLTQEVPDLTVGPEVAERAGPTGTYSPSAASHASVPPPFHPGDPFAGAQDLELAPELSGQAGSRFTRTEQVARAPRVRAIPLHRLTFKRTFPPEAAPIQLVNISSGGVGFLRSSALVWPPKGSVIQGSLVIQGAKEIQIRAKIARIGPLVVGCTFEGASQELTSFIENYFKVEFEALRAKDVSGQLPAQPDGVTAKHYAGENGCEAFYALEGERVSSWFVAVFGHRIECDAAGKLKYLPADGQPGRNLPPEVLQNAIRFVENIERLDENVRSSITYLLSRIRVAA